MSKKAEMYLFIVIAAVLFAVGQVMFIVNSAFVTGGIFMGLAILVAILYFSGVYEKLKVSSVGLFVKLRESIKQQQLNPGVLPRDNAVKKSSVNITPQKKEIIAKAGNPVPKDNQQKQVFKIAFSRNWLLAAAGLCFAGAQVFLMMQKYVPAAALLGAALVILLYFVINKNSVIGLDLEFENTTKILFALSGFILLVAGWVLLINRGNMIQNIGVGVTTVGIFLLFWGLPENKMAYEDREGGQEILFTGNRFLDNIWVKLALLGIMVLALIVGNKIAFHTSLGLYSMVFYAAAIASFFFAMPLIPYKEVINDNKFMNYLKVVAVIAAVFLAYLGQKQFLAEKVNDAVIYYIIAAAVLITFFPVSLKTGDKQPFSLKTEYIFVIGVTLLALFLRVYELDKRPFGLENDESGGMISVVKNFWVGQHPIYAYIWELCYNVFGLTRVGLRMYGVLLGTLSIPIMYFAVRSIFNVRTAMFASVLFAFLRWNLHYGRSGHGTVMAIVAITLAVFFIFKAIQKRDKFTYFMAGAMSGLCWYGILTGWFVVLAPLLYFVFESFSKKNYFKRNMVGLLVFMLGFWLFASQHIKNYFISTNTYFSRISEVSVFSQDPNAPVKNPAIGIIENTQRVLLMFNHHGDSRQRNSGGNPYEPAVDFVTAMLFGLGFFYCIYYSKFNAFFILVMLFFSQAAGSIFAIEAPSAMRAVGTMIPMIFFASVVFDKVWYAFSNVFKGKFRDVIVFPLLLACFLVPIIIANYNQYFKRWVGGMDELSTATGTYAQKLGKDYRVFLYTGLYYPGHPPFRIQRWDYKVDASIEPADNDSVLAKVDSENYAIFFHYDVWQTEDIWKQMYPNAAFDTFSHPGFGKMFDVLMIQNADIAAMRGLSGRVAGNSVNNALPVFNAEDNGKVPYNITLEGKVLIPYYADCYFGNTGTAKVSYTIDGISVNDSNQKIRLAKGFHNIRITGSRKSVSDTLYPVMSLFRVVGNSRGGREIYTLNERYLYSIKDNGLRAVFYAGEKWEGAVNNEVITPAALFARANDAVKLSGYLNVPDGAEYKFIPSNNGFLAIVVDGRQYWDNMAGSIIKEAIYKPGMKKVSTFRLESGKHKIEVYTLGASFLSLRLSVNGGEERGFNFGELEPDYSRISYN
ncbi:MAG: hypothetical protein CVV21_01665 [Candidatus Goldiibacteriota bacterium HGW-Goldbacteria-1]|nr:MAG: hypothetical protein CVV21_01665 [Candidatus Goldiibacteriota bacterium HGW-Goldbacteria-1]